MIDWSLSIAKIHISTIKPIGWMKWKKLTLYEATFLPDQGKEKVEFPFQNWDE